jgi:phosphoadenosine phosphosulfate reductase
MTVEEIHQQLAAYHHQGKKMFATSSFQSHSIPLLHILSTAPVPVDILFLQTGFHFPETVAFKDRIAKLFNLRITDIVSPVSRHQQMDSSGRFFYSSDPDHCCYLNKTLPIEPYLQIYDVWVNGIRADQSSTRQAMTTEQEGAHGILRFHPMLQWNSKMVYEYSKKHRLPKHPLEDLGYLSVGCEPCTQKMTLDSRDGRWAGLNKTECGLHTDLAANNNKRS